MMPRRYNPPLIRPTRCRRCRGKVIALGEEDYDACDGGPVFRARMWHCQGCGGSYIEAIPGPAWPPTGTPIPAVTPLAATSELDVSDQRQASIPRPAPGHFEEEER